MLTGQKNLIGDKEKRAKTFKFGVLLWCCVYGHGRVDVEGCRGLGRWYGAVVHGVCFWFREVICIGHRKAMYASD